MPWPEERGPLSPWLRSSSRIHPERCPCRWTSRHFVTTWTALSVGEPCAPLSGWTDVSSTSRRAACPPTQALPTPRRGRQGPAHLRASRRLGKSRRLPVSRLRAGSECLWLPLPLHHRGQERRWSRPRMQAGSWRAFHRPRRGPPARGSTGRGLANTRPVADKRGDVRPYREGVAHTLLVALDAAVSEVVGCSNATEGCPRHFANPKGLGRRTDRGPTRKRRRSSKNQACLDSDPRSVALAARRCLRDL